MDYREAGVDPERAYRALDRVKDRIATTLRKEVVPNPGGFAGLFALGRYEDPVLVSGTDGVGTKLKLAIELDRHEGVGIDLVAMCVNDILVQGAEPLFFLDYIAAGRLDPDRLARVLEGVCKGCEDARCALLGGETAEMPGMYAEGDYDLAGFAVGVVERAALITGDAVQEGDAVIGLASRGVHSNGFSLVRAVLKGGRLDAADTPEVLGGRTVGEELMTPTRIYVRPVRALLGDRELGPAIRAMAHITGDGLPGNLPRVLPAGLGAELHPSRWTRPPIFDLLQAAGPIDPSEMARVFNLGVGFALVVAPSRAEEVVGHLRSRGETAWRIGSVVRGEGVRLKDA